MSLICLFVQPTFNTCLLCMLPSLITWIMKMMKYLFKILKSFQRLERQIYFNTGVIKSWPGLWSKQDYIEHTHSADRSWTLCCLSYQNSQIISSIVLLCQNSEVSIYCQNLKLQHKTPRLDIFIKLIPIIPFISCFVKRLYVGTWLCLHYNKLLEDKKYYLHIFLSPTGPKSTLYMASQLTIP